MDEGCGVASCAIREAVRATAAVDLSAPNLTLTTHELTLDYGTASPVTLAACAQGAPHASRPRESDVGPFAETPLAPAGLGV